MDEGGGAQAALVTGAAGGIGAAVCRRLRAGGWRVAGLDRTSPAPEVRDAADAWWEADVRDDAAVATVVAEAAGKLGGLRGVVYAAGITRDAVLWKLDLEAWDEVLAVNARGAFSVLRHAVPVLRAGGGGSVVLLGSINGSRGKFGQSAYAASKAALLGLAKTAARETGRFGVRVNVVEPGMVRTPMTGALPERFREEALRETLLGRLGEPEDVAEVVAFLMGDGARHVTGQVWRVDGGQYL